MEKWKLFTVIIYKTDVRRQKGETSTHTTAGNILLLLSSVVTPPFQSVSVLLSCVSTVIIEGGEVVSLHRDDLWPAETNEAPQCLEIVNDWEGKRRKFARGMIPVAFSVFEWINEPPRFISSHFTVETVSQIFQFGRNKKIVFLCKNNKGVFCF